MINFVIQVYRNTNIVFIESFGLYWQQRFKPIVEAGLNLIISLILLVVFKIGINGVLLGTIASSIGFVFWFELYVVSRYALSSKIRTNIITYLKYFAQLALSILIIFLSNRIEIIKFDSNLIYFVFKCIFSFVISLIMYLIFYFRTDEFKFILSVAKRLIRR